MGMNLPEGLEPTFREKLGLWGLPGYARRIKGVIMTDLVTQRTALPTRKLGTAGVGVTAGLIIWAMRQFAGIEVLPAEAEILVAAAATIAAWFVKDRRHS